MWQFWHTHCIYILHSPVPTRSIMEAINPILLTHSGDKNSIKMEIFPNATHMWSWQDMYHYVFLQEHRSSIYDWGPIFTDTTSQEPYPSDYELVWIVISTRLSTNPKLKRMSEADPKATTFDRCAERDNEYETWGKNSVRLETVETGRQLTYTDPVCFSVKPPFLKVIDGRPFVSK